MPQRPPRQRLSSNALVATELSISIGTRSRTYSRQCRQLQVSARNRDALEWSPKDREVLVLQKRPPPSDEPTNFSSAVASDTTLGLRASVFEVPPWA
jgi:DNA-binding transcriptional MocR family regulator